MKKSLFRIALFPICMMWLSIPLLINPNPIPLYPVTFIVQDYNHQPIEDATITFGNVTNPAGNYTFIHVASGIYSYTVVRDGYFTASGSVTVNNNVVLTVTMHPLIYDECDKFVKTYPGSNQQQILSSTRTWDGGIVMAGFTQTINMGKDLLILKIDRWGNLAWSRRMEKPEDQVAYSVIETHDKGLVITGYTRHLGPRNNLLLAKFNEHGVLLWSYLLHKDPPLPIESIGYGVIEDVTDNNRLVVTGELHREALGRREAFLAKFDSSGTFLQISSRYAVGYDLSGYSLTQADGGFIVVGRSKALRERMLLMRFHQNGNFDWAYHFTDNNGNPAFERAVSVIKTSDNGIAYTGYRDNDCFICKWDAGWEDYWCRKFTSGTSRGHSITEVNDTLYITGASDNNEKVLIASFRKNNLDCINARTHNVSGVGYSISGVDYGRNLLVSGYSSLQSTTDNALALKAVKPSLNTCMLETGWSVCPPYWTIDHQFFVTAPSFPSFSQSNASLIPKVINLSTNIICSNCTPVAIIDSIVPNPACVNDTVWFYGLAECPYGGEIVQYEWSTPVESSFGGVYDSIISTEPIFFTQFQAPKDYLIKFRVKSSHDLWSQKATSTLSLLNKPIAFIDSIVPDYASVNETIYFWGSGEDYCGEEILEYQWLLINENDTTLLSTDQNFQTAFSYPGSLNIDFMVKNAVGLWSDPVSEDIVILSDTLILSGTILPFLNPDPLCFFHPNIIHAYDFYVESGGSVILIAGKEIIFNQEIKISSGAHFHAFIDTTGNNCNFYQPGNILTVDLVQDKAMSGEEMHTLFYDYDEDQMIMAYPNPTTGKLMITFKEPSEATNISIEIFGMMGELLFKTETPASSHYLFDISHMKPGVYIVRIIQERGTAMLKIIKQ